MKSVQIQPDERIALFVKNILVFEEYESNKKTSLPFFADGYPGLIFYQSEMPLVIQPQQKTMPLFFLYGQTLHPIELLFESSYQLIVYQFYPFIIKSFFNLNPESINDDCYNLQPFDNEENRIISSLENASSWKERVQLIDEFLLSLYELKKEKLDDTLKQALEMMIDYKGQIKVSDVRKQLHVQERTFERRFLAETGLTPKQFAKILQFQASLEQLNSKDYDKLTDIVYENGFADQSHFIKVFKDFTGKTPKSFAGK